MIWKSSSWVPSGTRQGLFPTVEFINTQIQIQIHKYTLRQSATNTKHMLYFWKAGGSRMSKMIFPSARFTNTGTQIYLMNLIRICEINALFTHHPLSLSPTQGSTFNTAETLWANNILGKPLKKKRANASLVPQNCKSYQECWYISSLEFLWGISTRLQTGREKALGG